MIEALNQKKKRREYLVTVILLVMLVGMVFLTLFHDGVPSDFVLKTLRIPRVVTGVLAGIAFGLAGNTFQSLLRNSLASPDIIGVSSGASVAAVFCILILGLSGAVVSWIAVIAGLVVSVAIYLLSMGYGYSDGKMILVGIGAQAFLQALVSWILLKGSEFDVPTALRWLSGSLNGAQQRNVPRLFLVTLIAGGVILYLVSHIRMMEMGEEYAVSLGVEPGRIRIIAMVCAILLISFATATTGPIASVAFLSGPIASRLVGKGRNNMLAAGLVGAVLIVTADFVGQNFWSVRYPVGVITGLLGAPYLLFLLINMNRKGEREK